MINFHNTSLTTKSFSKSKAELDILNGKLLSQIWSDLQLSINMEAYGWIFPQFWFMEFLGLRILRSFHTFWPTQTFKTANNLIWSFLTFRSTKVALKKETLMGKSKNGFLGTRFGFLQVRRRRQQWQHGEEISKSIFKVLYKWCKKNKVKRIIFSGQCGDNIWIQTKLLVKWFNKSSSILISNWLYSDKGKTPTSNSKSSDYQDKWDLWQ